MITQEEASTLLCISTSTHKQIYRATQSTLADLSNSEIATAPSRDAAQTSSSLPVPDDSTDKACLRRIPIVNIQSEQQQSTCMVLHKRCST